MSRADRVRAEDEVLACIHPFEPQEEAAAAALGLEGILDGGARGADAEGVVIEAKALEGLHLELLVQDAAAGVSGVRQGSRQVCWRGPAELLGELKCPAGDPLGRAAPPGPPVRVRP